MITPPHNVIFTSPHDSSPAQTRARGHEGNFYIWRNDPNDQREESLLVLIGGRLRVVADMESVHYFNDHSGSVSPHA